MARLTIPDEQTFAEFDVVTSTAAFPITFSLFAKADLTVLVDGSDIGQSAFTFTGTVLEGGGYDGGTVTLNDAVDDVAVRIERNVAPARTSNFAPASTTPVGAVDQAINRQVAIDQDQSRRIGDVEDGLLAVGDIDAALAATEAARDETLQAIEDAPNLVTNKADKSSISGTPKDEGATANGAADDRAAILAAQTAYDAINLVPLSGGSTYRMETASAADFTSPIYAADGVTLSLPSSLGGGSDAYSTLAALDFRTPTTVTFRDASFSNRFGPEPDPWLKPLPGLTHRLRKWSAAPLGGANVAIRHVSWPAGDAWTDITPSGSTSADVSFTTSGGGGFTAAFASIAVGETLRQTLKSFSAADHVGVVVRGTLGYAVIFSPPGESDALAFRAFKLTGVAVDQAQVLEYPNRGVNDTFAFDKVEWSVTRTDDDKVLVKANGVGLTITGRGIGAIGDIQEVGLAVFSSGGDTYTMSGHIIEKSDEMLGMLPMGGIKIFGDSTAEDMANCWTRDLPALMDGFQGVTLGPITNNAVVSTTAADAYTAMSVAGALDGAEIIGVCTGSNDVQELTDRATFTTTVQNICNLVVAAGARLVWQIPYLWYGTADAGGTGFGATNADEGAWYRNEIMRIVSASGQTYVDTAGYLGNPDPTQRLEPKGGGQLRDNIHQTSKGHQLYAIAFAKAALSSYCALPTSGRSALWEDLLESGVTIASGVPFGYRWDGNTYRLYGLLDVTTITDATPLFTLPRFLWPDITERASIQAFDAGSAPLAGAPYLNVGFDGTATLQGAPVGTVRIDVRDVVIVRS